MIKILNPSPPTVIMPLPTNNPNEFQLIRIDIYIDASSFFVYLNLTS